MHNMVASEQYFQQQNFYEQQRQYLGNNQRGNDSSDSLFEMAAMLDNHPSSEQTLSSNNFNASWNMNMNKLSSAQSGLTNPFLSLGNPRSARPSNVQVAVQTVIVDLFDDSELDSVLGDVDQRSAPIQQTLQYQPPVLISPNTSERTTPTQTSVSYEAQVHEEPIATSFDLELRLPDETLEDILRQDTARKGSDGDNQDEWHLIDFGDDNQEPTNLNLNNRRSRDSYDSFTELVKPPKKKHRF